MQSVDTMPNRFYVVLSYVLLFLPGFQKSIVIPSPLGGGMFVQIIHPCRRMQNFFSFCKKVLQRSMPADSNVQFLKITNKIASTPATPHNQFICLQWKEIVWSIPFYALYFSSMAICLPLSILKYYHIFSHFPIHGIFYYEYWIPK